MNIFKDNYYHTHSDSDKVLIFSQWSTLSKHNRLVVGLNKVLRKPFLE